ncbi:type II toxin-antitoxin system antitoxin SocA domain-containing protein [Bradyrhizobium sp. RT7b]|uniref:Panacea domain-containing protein n=1 Tax=unclassified Bradyrhizobium TaxID=2631580 RepID=UPI003390E4C1
MNIYDACDYIVLKLTHGGVFLNVLKLHKLLYYCQAWNLAFGRGRLFSASFQAWVHGPVSRDIYDRYVGTKAMYSNVTAADVRSNFDPQSLEQNDRALIDSVLEVYAPLSGDQLEEMTHKEDPWLNARAGVPPSARSEHIISDDVMRDYYAARIKRV